MEEIVIAIIRGVLLGLTIMIPYRFNEAMDKKVPVFEFRYIDAYVVIYTFIMSILLSR